MVPVAAFVTPENAVEQLKMRERLVPADEAMSRLTLQAWKEISEPITLRPNSTRSEVWSMMTLATSPEKSMSLAPTVSSTMSSVRPARPRRAA